MNPRVEEFISSAKKKLEEQQKQERERILINSGLFDIEIKESSERTDECDRFDHSKNLWVGKKKIPLEVTDEEYAEILKYQTTEIEYEKPVEIDAAQEETLKGVASFILIAGIITSIIFLFAICIVTVQVPGEYSFSSPKTITEFNAAGLVPTISIFLGSIALSSTMKVIANISVSLKEIKHRFK